MNRRVKDALEHGITTTFFSAPRVHTQARRLVLKVRTGPEAGKRIDVTRTRVSIGRSAVNDLVLTDHAVSATHCELTVSDNGVKVSDMGSTNGTLIHGVRIAQAWVEPGMVIVVGKTEIELCSADQVEVPLSEEDHFGAMWGASPAMREVFAMLERLAKIDMNVLVCGETGTGKELVARALHDESPRADKPFVILDCGTLPRELAEGAILGHRRGSFTGATTDRAGAFEEAHGGTLFLDEIGELPLELQPKLLRVLDRQEVQRVGEHQIRKVDVRVVAATHRDLRKMVGQGTFREDLYFRLSVLEVDLPPLRERGDDVLLLAERFVDDFRRNAPAPVVLTDAARAALRANDWPGNVRQLKNTIARACHLSSGGRIEPADLHLGARDPARPVAGAESSTSGAARPGPSFDALIDPQIWSIPYKEAKQAVQDVFDMLYIERLNERFGGNLSRAAAEAGLTRYYLRELVRRHQATKELMDDGDG